MPDDESDAPEEIPTEDDTLLGGENEDEFNLGAFEARLAAGKYDGALLLMDGLIMDRAIIENRRRWHCTFRGVEYREEDLDAEVAEFAEQYAGQGWGYLNALLGDNVRAVIKPARAVLYGICRGELKMDAAKAKRAIKMPAAEVMACFGWHEVEPAGKAEG